MIECDCVDCEECRHFLELHRKIINEEVNEDGEKK